MTICKWAESVRFKLRSPSAVSFLLLSCLVSFLRQGLTTQIYLPLLRLKACATTPGFFYLFYCNCLLHRPKNSQRELYWHKKISESKGLNLLVSNCLIQIAHKGHWSWLLLIFKQLLDSSSLVEDLKYLPTPSFLMFRSSFLWWPLNNGNILKAHKNRSEHTKF